MAQKSLTEKDLSILSDLLSYEQWAMKKSQMYESVFTDPEIKGLCKNLADNHSKNFDELMGYLNSY